jgi:hypothetical protein
MLTLEQVKAATDLHEKCGRDILHAITDFCDQAPANGTIKLHVATSAICSAGAVAAMFMGGKELIFNRPATDMADASLFALIFGWLLKEPGGIKDEDDLFQRAKAGWEATTGRTLDPSWMQPELRKHYDKPTEN